MTRAAPARGNGAVLRTIADVPLPGPAVRFDYQSLDTSANRLYLSHMNAGDLVVFDVTSRKVIGTVGELPRVTGVWCVPALEKIYASVPGRRHVAVIDAHTLRVEARVAQDLRLRRIRRRRARDRRPHQSRGHAHSSPG
jgi:hypothetical protein